MGLIDQIKKEATGNRTKIQGSEAAKLERIFNELFFLPKKVTEETEFVRKVMTRGGQQERVGLHASSFIVGEKDYCIRAQVLSLFYRQIQHENTPVNLKRIFTEGDAIHEKWQRLLIRGGYANSKTLDRTRFADQYMISYTPDAVCRIKPFYAGLMIGEFKSVNTFQYQKMIAHPSARKQLQWYMHLSGIHYGFVLNEDKNNQEFKLEIYEYDPASVAEPIDRAEAVVYYYQKAIDGGKIVGRPSDVSGPNSKKCSKCIMQAACWNIGMGRIKLE